MTELKRKALTAKNITKEALYRAFEGILTLWALSLVSFIAYRVVTPENFAKPSAGLWSVVTLLITSLFVIIHSRFKK